MRTRLLAGYAFLGSLPLCFFDWIFSRAAPDAPSPGRLAATRLGFMVIPAAGWLVARFAPGWRHLPGLVMASSVLWTWGNAWAYFALGLSGTVVQAIALVLCLITSATFLPLLLRGRAGLYLIMAAGQLALDLAWPGPLALPLGQRLWNDAAMLTVLVVLVIIFENFASSQRRGLELRRHLEGTVAELKASRQRAEAAAAAVGRLAAEVAHEVNNPLAAVKANVRLLAAAPHPDDRHGDGAEAATDALDAVERISRIVTELRRQAARYADQAAGGESGAADSAPAPGPRPGAAGPGDRN